MLKAERIKRSKAKRTALKEDMLHLSDTLRAKKPTVESALRQMAEVLIFLLEEKDAKR